MQFIGADAAPGLGVMCSNGTIMNTENKYLILAGCSSFFIALLHIVIILGRGVWYRFFGAGDKMAAMVQNGSLYPGFLTGLFSSLISLVVGLFCAIGTLKSWYRLVNNKKGT